MPDELRRHRLSQTDRDFILQRLARNHRPQRIVNDLQMERGVKTTRQNVDAYKKHNPEIVQTLRAQFIASLGSNSLIEKAERITELEKMYNAFLENCAGSYSQDSIEVLQSLIAQIQKEVEPLKIQGEGIASGPIFIIQSNHNQPKTEDKPQDFSKRFRLEPGTLSGDDLGVGDRKDDVRDS